MSDPSDRSRSVADRRPPAAAPQRESEGTPKLSASPSQFVSTPHSHLETRSRAATTISVIRSGLPAASHQQVSDLPACTPTTSGGSWKRDHTAPLPQPAPWRTRGRTTRTLPVKQERVRDKLEKYVEDMELLRYFGRFPPLNAAEVTDRGAGHWGMIASAYAWWSTSRRGRRRRCSWCPARWTSAQ